MDLGTGDLLDAGTVLPPGCVLLTATRLQQQKRLNPVVCFPSHGAGTGLDTGKIDRLNLPGEPAEETGLSFR